MTNTLHHQAIQRELLVELAVLRAVLQTLEVWGANCPGFANTLPPHPIPGDPGKA